MHFTLRCPMTVTLSPAGDDVGAWPEAWLHGTFTVLGVDHHLEAIAVTEDERGQHAEAPILDDQLDDYASAASAERPFDTVSLGTRTYVLVMTPFAANTLCSKAQS